MKSARLTRTLIAIDALLVIVLAALWLAPGPPAHWRNWRAPEPQAPNLDDARAAQLAPNPALRRDYPAIVERPLFAADRKPRQSASDAPAAAPPDSLDQAQLYGLVDGPTAQGVLLEHDGRSQFVQRGEKIGDWTLQAIEGRDAIFVKGGERRTVRLPDSLTDPARAAASVPVPAAPNPAAVLPRPYPPPSPGNISKAVPLPARPGVARPGVQAQWRPGVLAAGGCWPVAPHTSDGFLNQTGLDRIAAKA